jgi:hypothetical protein
MPDKVPTTEDGLDSTTESLRRAVENTPSGASPKDVEATPVFDELIFRQKSSGVQ